MSCGTGVKAVKGQADHPKEMCRRMLHRVALDGFVENVSGFNHF